MTPNTKSCIAFLAVVGLSCLLAWLGGYNFDQRNEDVALCAMFVVFFAGFAAVQARTKIEL